MQFKYAKNVVKTNFIESLKQFYLSHKVVYNCGILAILFFFNCFTGAVSFWVWTFLIGLLIVDDINNGMSYFIFSVPFCQIDVKYGAYFLIACMVVYIVRLYIIKYVIQKNSLNYDVLYVFLMFLIFILIPIRQVTITTFFTALMMFSLFMVVNAVLNFPKVFDVKKNVKFFALGILVSVVYSLNYFIADYIYFTTSFYDMNEHIIRFAALTGQPNALAMFCEFGLIIILYYIFSGKAKLLDYLCFVFFAIVGITTFSKTFLILFAIIMLSLLIYLFIKKWKVALAITISGIILLALFVVLKKDLVMIYLNRFFDKEALFGGDIQTILNYITTDRYDLWVEYLTALSESPMAILFGFGAIKPRLGILSTHNVYINVLYQFGIVGVIILITLIVLIIKNFVKKFNLKFNKALIVPLIVVGLLFMVEDLIFFIY